MKILILYRKLAALIFLAAIFGHSFSKMFIVLDYYTNTASYAVNCINKSNPELYCNGKCQMIKKLQQEDKSDNKYPQKKNENKNDITLFPGSHFTHTFLKCIFKKHALQIDKIGSDTIDRSFGIFHPPQFC